MVGNNVKTFNKILTFTVFASYGNSFIITFIHYKNINPIGGRLLRFYCIDKIKIIYTAQVFLYNTLALHLLYLHYE